MVGEALGALAGSEGGGGGAAWKASLLAARCGLLLRLSRPSDAVPVCRSALAPAAETEGSGSVLVGKLHAYLAAAHAELGEGKQALAAGLQALPLLRKGLGGDSRAVRNVAVTLQRAMGEGEGGGRGGKGVEEVEALARAALVAAEKRTGVV